jgi:hypothetical protein
VTRGRGRRRRTVGGGGLVTAEVGGVEGAAGVAGVFKILAFFFGRGCGFCISRVRLCI